MRRFQRYFIGLTLFIFTPPLHASSGTEGASFLDIPVGAGPAALGSAYAAAASDAYAPIYNPAGLAFLSAPQLAAQQLSYLQSINYEFGSVVVPLGHSSEDQKQTKGLGASVQYLGSGDIPGTDPAGNPTGSFTASYAVYSLAYGQKLTDSLSLGLTGKAIDAKIADVSAIAYAADLGLMLQPLDTLTLAATFTNLGSKLTFTDQGDSLPEAFNLGGAYQLDPHFSVNLQGVYDRTGLFSGRTGVEWRPLEAISIRAGYRTDTLSHLSAIAGLSTGLGVHLWGQELAYAWVPYGDLGDTQYFSLLIKFGGKDEERKNLIQYQDIKRHTTVQQPRNAQHSGSAFGQPQEPWNQSGDPDAQQLMQLLNDEPQRNALAPALGTEKQP